MEHLAVMLPTRDVLVIRWGISTASGPGWNPGREPYVDDMDVVDAETGDPVELTGDELRLVETAVLRAARE